jgi:hypothetical protein
VLVDGEELQENFVKIATWWRGRGPGRTCHRISCGLFGSDAGQPGSAAHVVFRRVVSEYIMERTVWEDNEGDDVVDSPI